MSTQTESTQEIMKSDGQQITPIIIKSGGGGGGAEAANQVQIQSGMEFEPSLASALEGSWEESRSKYFGRITEVSITDGDAPPYDIPITPNSNPVSVTIYCGPDVQVVLSEEDIVDSERAHLAIQSDEVPFQVTRRKGLVGWVDSAASFSNQITSVVIMQGETLIKDYNCTSPDISLSVIFHRAELL